MDVDNFQKLIYNRRSSTDFGALITYPFAITQAKRDVSSVSIPGVNGDYINDNLKYQNINQIIPFTVFRPKQYKSWFDWTAAFTQWLIPNSEATYQYQQYNLTLWQGYIYEAVMSDAPVLTIKDETMATAQITLNCKPFLKREDGINYQPVPARVQNTELSTALPIIHIAGSGDFTLTINDVDYKLTGIDDEVYIDSEKYLVYKSLSQNRAANALFANNDFPTLKPGWNSIKLIGNYSKFEYKPNWRRLI